MTGNVYTYLFRILMQNKQKPITNSCRKNLWSKLILTLSKTEFKILRKKPGDEAFSGFMQIPEARMRSKACRFQQIFKYRNTELLLFFSIITPCIDRCDFDITFCRLLYITEIRLTKLHRSIQLAFYYQ